MPAGFAGLRIGLIEPVPPPAGGMANQARQLAELLRAAGAEVTSVSINPAHRPARVACVSVLRAGYHLLSHLLAVWRAAGANALLHVRANSGGSWHLYSTTTPVMGRLRRTPVMINYRGAEAVDFLARSVSRVRWAMRSAACLAVPSGFLAGVFARYGMQAHSLPNIVDLSRFHPSENAPDTGRHQLVVARNLEPLYDIGTAIRAFALVHAVHPDAMLTIVGTRPEAAALRQLGREQGIDSAVHWVDRLDGKQMADLYRNADLRLNPSLADNMPNSVLESLANAVPVVSTEIGGGPFLFKHRRTGLLVPAGQPCAMADVPAELFENAVLRRQPRQAGLAEVQRYTWPRLAPVLAAIYRDAQSGPAHRRRRPIGKKI